jgi:hypothetical protein
VPIASATYAFEFIPVFPLPFAFAVLSRGSLPENLFLHAIHRFDIRAEPLPTVRRARRTATPAAEKRQKGLIGV